MSPRQRIDYLADIGVRQGGHIVISKQRTCISNETNCWLFQGSINTDGYAQIQGNNRKSYLLHVISYMVHNSRNPENHVSHLCNNRTCFNPCHLVDETALVINSRKGCVGPIFCPDHGHLLVNVCPHQPLCVRPAKDREMDTKCCLSLLGMERAVDKQAGGREDSALITFIRETSESFNGATELEEPLAARLLSKHFTQ